MSCEVRVPFSGQSTILLVDDSDADVCLMQVALTRARLDNPVQIVSRGEEALSYLKGELQYGDRTKFPLPGLILLDLKMPGMGGFEVLKWIRQQPAFNWLPIVVLTSSDEIHDANDAYKLGANSFMVKPMDFENYVAMSASLKDYWLRRSETAFLLRSTVAPAAQPLSAG